MNEFQRETIDRIKAFAIEQENYEAGWDIIVECYTDEEILELIAGDTDEEYATMVSIYGGYGGEVEREMPATTWTDAFARVKKVVDLHDEQRRAVQNEIW